jgi:hypothetical protein
MANAMSETQQQKIAETLFERSREEIKDAIRVEEERRAALVKNLYRLRALRLSRDQNRMRIQEGSG